MVFQTSRKIVLRMSSSSAAKVDLDGLVSFIESEFVRILGGLSTSISFESTAKIVPSDGRVSEVYPKVVATIDAVDMDAVELALDLAVPNLARGLIDLAESAPGVRIDTYKRPGDEALRDGRS